MIVLAQRRGLIPLKGVVAMHRGSDRLGGRLAGVFLALAVFLVLSPTDVRSAHPSGPEVTEKACTDCHSEYAAPQESATSTGHYYVDITCTDCHLMSGTSNLHLISEVIETWYTGPREVIFTRYFGKNSYADGDTVYDGVCEVCHTTTAYHRGDSSGDHTHHAGVDCTVCHPHGFFAPIQVGVPEDDPAGLTARVFPVPSRGPVGVRVPRASGSPLESVEVTVFDITGRKIRALPPTRAESGVVSWDGRDDAGIRAEPGVYFLRVFDGDRTWSGKAVLIP
jgi:hypothetical protein